MKNKASFITLLVLGLGAMGALISAGCQQGDPPADTSGVKTPDQAEKEGIPTPDAASGAGTGGGTAGSAGTMETGA